MIQTDNEREISEVLSIYNTPPHSPNQTSQPSNSPFHNYEHPIFPVNKQLQIVNYDTLNARRRSLQPNSIHLNTNTNNFNNFKRRPSFVIETPYTNPTSGNEILTYNPFFLSSFNGTNNESGEKIPDQSCQPLSSDSYFNTKYPDLNLSNNDVDTNINSQSNNQSTILFNSFSSELPQNLNIKNNLQQQIFSASEENVIRRFQPDYYPVEQRRHSIQLIPNPQNANYFSILGDTSISNSSTSTFQNDFHQYDRRQSCIDFGSNQNLKYSSINEDSLNLKLEDFKVKNENFEEENTKAESTTDGDTEFIPLVQGFSKNSKNSKKIAKSYPCHICGRNFAR
ncbi:hypothetical protein HDU92_001314 [Lobulomyces angularis]|nr:hypothetical protein HDU92_001314 [Lobulomyces angularis]